MITAPITRVNPSLGGRGQSLRLVALRSSTSPTPSFENNALSTIAPKRKSMQNKAFGSRNPAIMASTAASDSKMAVGDNVSSVNATLLTNEEKEVNLSQICKDQGVVIFAYPKAATSGCTVQACGFRDNYDLIKEAGYEVYGLSFDPPQSQTDWKIKENLQYLLLTDTDGAALKAFGAFKEPQNVVRSHLVIEKGGKILLLENGVKSGDSFGQVVEFISNLKK
ncbi:hypothetical protein Ndes2526B_g05701 [Nannochloris sp. 'desiccata']|nr:hypothetical protein KSW81_007537 [Chlorella desiccata (nom. nud.)]